MLDWGFGEDNINNNKQERNMVQFNREEIEFNTHYETDAVEKVTSKAADAAVSLSKIIDDLNKTVEDINSTFEEVEKSEERLLKAIAEMKRKINERKVQ